MRRFLVLAAIAALVIALPLAHSALAAPEAKVLLCHLNSSNTPATFVYDYQYHYYGTDYAFHQEYTYSFGNVIEVSENAVDAHLAHGDSTAYYPLDDYVIGVLESWDEWDYYSSWDYRPDYDYYGYYSGDYTNGEVKNADCYTFSYTG